MDLELSYIRSNIMSLENTSGLSMTMLPAQVLGNNLVEEKIESNMEDRKVTKEPSKFSGIISKIYQEVIHNEIFQSFVGLVGHLAIGISEGIAVTKAKEVISSKTKDENSPYGKLAEVTIQETAKVAKEMLPKKPLPAPLFSSLSNTLIGYQMAALEADRNKV